MSKNKVEKELIKAQEFYKAKKYSKTIEIYDNYFIDNFDEFTKWDRIFYAWSLFYTKIKNFNNHNDLIENAKKILFLVPQIDGSQKNLACPYTTTVFSIIKYYVDKNRFEKVIEWAQKLDHNLLSKSAVIINGIKYQSNREKWYNYISKALLKIEEYEDSIFICKEALNDLDDVYGDNNVWFKFRIAQAEKELGNFDDAISYLKDIVDYKTEWYVQYEIADNYFLKTDYEESLKFAFKAALNNGSSIMKTNLYLLISDLLETKEIYKKANDHLYLIFALKKEHSFSIDESLKEQLIQENYDLENINSKDIERELRKYWISSID